MLSASAARMGCVHTTLRHIGKGSRRFSVATGLRESLKKSPVWKANNLSRARAAVTSDVYRWKSTMAPYSDSDDEEDTNKFHGHAEAAKVRSTHSHAEAWMVNLGRGDNNEWLLGPRDADEWFTGLKPSNCPGKYKYSDYRA